jgi:hypothetical protein
MHLHGGWIGIIHVSAFCVTPKTRAILEPMQCFFLSALATCFSAKGAFIMAIRACMTMHMRWRACQIGQASSVLRGGLKRQFKPQGLITSVSVTDEAVCPASACVVKHCVYP